jgi:enterobactin synthetase component D
MELIPVTAPHVLPDFVACYAARLVGGDHREHFAAGRECASRAINQVLGRQPVSALPRGQAGEPVWPAGVTGSITHTGDYVAAAAALASTARGVGLDAEHIVSAERAARIAATVTDDGEAPTGGGTLSPAAKVTLLFSIKESVFKCLYPLVLKRFYYSALRVRELDFGTGRFHAELTVNLSVDFQSGCELSGGFQIDDLRVYAGICLPPLPSASEDG